MKVTTERMLWIATGVMTILAIVGARLPLRSAPVSRVPETRTPMEVSMFDPNVLDNASMQAVAHDPFRLERRPSDLAFGDPAVAQPSGPVRPSVQSVMLKGIVGGPPWQAVLAGVPGRSGSVVVRSGDTLAGLRVTQIRRDAIVLSGADSLLKLTLQRTWQ